MICSPLSPLTPKHTTRKFRKRKAQSGRLQKSGDQHSHAFDPPHPLKVTSKISDNINVIVRIRPISTFEKNQEVVVHPLNPKSLIFDPKSNLIGTENCSPFYFHGTRQRLVNVHRSSNIRRSHKNIEFHFDYVFGPDVSNIEIFNCSLKPLVAHVLTGYNCSAFAYGATGSGKTYTMLGSATNPGIVFLMAKELQRSIKQMSAEYESELKISYMEVYNEAIRDLLGPTSKSNSDSKNGTTGTEGGAAQLPSVTSSSQYLNIREDGLHGINVPNLSVHKIVDTAELLRMLNQGNAARSQHPTDHNAESSRSHAIFQILVSLRKRISKGARDYQVTMAKLVLVDLAGSERGGGAYNGNGISGERAERSREGRNINRSLLALGNCINALADGKKHIPYRDSKLTRLLKDSLGGNCKTVMIANVAPTSLTFEDTYNTLKYADRAKEIRMERKSNISTEMTFDIQNYLQLEKEVTKLKRLLEKEREINEYLKEMEAQRGLKTEGHGNPSILEDFIQLLGQKKKFEEDYVNACISSKRAEWKATLKKWKKDRLEKLGVEECSKNLEKLQSNYEDEFRKIDLTKNLLDFNERELEIAQKETFSSTDANFQTNEPFLTVTLREFLYYKNLEREVSTCRSLANFFQELSGILLHELLSSQFHLEKSISIFQKGTNTSKNFSKFMKKLSKSNKILKKIQTSPSSQDLLTLLNTPIINPDDASQSHTEESQNEVEWENSTEFSHPKIPTSASIDEEDILKGHESMESILVEPIQSSVENPSVTSTSVKETSSEMSLPQDQEDHEPASQASYPLVYQAQVDVTPNSTLENKWDPNKNNELDHGISPKLKRKKKTNGTQVPSGCGDIGTAHAGGPDAKIKGNIPSARSFTEKYIVKPPPGYDNK